MAVADLLLKYPLLSVLRKSHNNIVTYYSSPKDYLDKAMNQHSNSEFKPDVVSIKCLNFSRYKNLKQEVNFV